MDKSHQECHQCDHQILEAHGGAELAETSGTRRHPRLVPERERNDAVARVGLDPRGIHAVTSNNRAEASRLSAQDPTARPSGQA
jgi:hypothetical protein